MPNPVDLRIPFTTLLEIVAFAGLVLVTIRLWPVIIMIILATLLAVVLDPVVEWLDAHRIRRGIAIALVGLFLFGLLAALLVFVFPAAVRELRDAGGELPRMSAELSQRVPQLKPYLDPLLASAQRAPTSVEVQRYLTRGLVAGRYAFEGLVAMVLVLVIALYLLVEGRQLFAWLTAFASPEHRVKIERTAREVSPIVFAYVRGQSFTCVLCSGVALTTLLLLRVPAAVPLAVLAFVADLVPVVGTIAMMVPAAALALAVGPVQALVVVVVYTAYHLIESYLIIPRVYGSQMQLSTLAVLFAVLAGSILLGALGAVIFLPLVAAYPIVEKIWLKDVVGRDTVKEHERLESAE